MDDQSDVAEPAIPVPPRLSTWEVLLSVGFRPDANVISDPPGGLSFDFGDFKLSASHVVGRSFQPVVMLSGVMTTSRSMTMMEIEMPRAVESWEQGVAWLTWCLDQHSPDKHFEAAKSVTWLETGRENRHLIPWERERAAYAARPVCHIRREWARLGIRDLTDGLARQSDDTLVRFTFDGEFLVIRFADSAIAMPAVGEIWADIFVIEAACLRRLPARLRHPMVECSVWRGALTLGTQLYPGMVPAATATEE